MSKQAIDLTGQTFDLLTVDHYLGHGIWHCVCRCGATRDVRGHKLRGGLAKGCFDCAPVRNPEGGKPRVDLVGRQFDQLTVEAYLGHSVWRCRCSCGNYRDAPTTSLNTGAVKRCTLCRADLQRVIKTI